MDKIIDIPIVSCIYKLTIGDHWYVGSSTKGILERMYVHYNWSERKPDRKLYKHVKDNGGWSKVKVEVLSISSTWTEEQLREEEDKLIKLDDPLCLNTDRAFVPFVERESRVKGAKKKYDDARKEKLKTDPEFLKAEREKAKIQQRERRAKKKAEVSAPPAN